MPGKGLLYHLSEVGFIYQAGGKICLEMIPKSDNLELRKLCHLEEQDNSRSAGSWFVP